MAETPAPTGRAGNVAIDGAKLRRIRQEAGLTIADLSRRCGVTEADLSRIENLRRRRVQAPTIRRIEAALGLAVGDLEAVTAPTTAPQSPEMDGVDRLRALMRDRAAA